MEDKIDLINTILEPSPYQCTISENDIRNRGDLLKNTVIGSSISSKIDSDTSTLTYHYEPSLAHDLLDFILKEQICCPFFVFDLEFQKEKNLLNLHISVTDPNVDLPAILAEMSNL